MFKTLIIFAQTVSEVTKGHGCTFKNSFIHLVYISWYYTVRQDDSPDLYLEILSEVNLNFQDIGRQTTAKYSNIQAFWPLIART